MTTGSDRAARSGGPTGDRACSDVRSARVGEGSVGVSRRHAVPPVVAGRAHDTDMETFVGARMDDAKGRAKEAAGVLADNKDLEREGKRDQAGATVKEKLDNVKDKLEDGVDKVKDKLNKH